MSVVGVTKHNEIINMILYQPPPPRPKSPMFVSKTEKLLKSQKVQPTHQTMGFAELPLRSAKCFLRKGGGVQVPIKKGIQVSENIAKNVGTCRKTNLEKNKIQRRKKKKELEFVDTPRGHKSNLLKYKWVYHKSFGTVPKYLIKQNEAIHKAEEKYREKLQNVVPICVPISPEERQELLDGLRHNHFEMQKAFLLLPILTDTIPKVLKKTYIEDRLRQLEKDIRVVEENPYIYIYE